MRYLSLSVLLMLFAISCKQPDNIQETRQAFLVKHTWKYTSMSVNGSLQTLDPCLIDDIWSFSPSGDMLINYGDIRCSAGQTPSLAGKYQLSADQNSLYVEALGTNYKVNTIDEYTLDVTEVMGADSTRYVLNAR